MGGHNLSEVRDFTSSGGMLVEMPNVRGDVEGCGTSCEIQRVSIGGCDSEERHVETGSWFS